MLAVREGPWKLFVHQDDNTVELYNVMRDRAETMNIANQYPDMVQRLKALAIEWKATLPTKPAAHTLSPSRANKANKPEEKKNKKDKKDKDMD